jgi:hypothetical protein
VGAKLKRGPTQQVVLLGCVRCKEGQELEQNGIRLFAFGRCFSVWKSNSRLRARGGGRELFLLCWWLPLGNLTCPILYPGNENYDGKKERMKREGRGEWEGMRKRERYIRANAQDRRGAFEHINTIRVCLNEGKRFVGKRGRRGGSIAIEAGKRGQQFTYQHFVAVW